MNKFLGEFDEVWVDDIDINIKIGDVVEFRPAYIDNDIGLTIGKRYRVIDICMGNSDFYFKVFNDLDNREFYLGRMFKKVF